MSFTYKPMLKTMIDREITREELRKKIGASPATFTRLWKGQTVSMDLLDRICTALDCQIEDVIRHEKD